MTGGQVKKLDIFIQKCGPMITASIERRLLVIFKTGSRSRVVEMYCDPIQLLGPLAIWSSMESIAKGSLGCMPLEASSYSLSTRNKKGFSARAVVQVAMSVRRHQLM